MTDLFSPRRADGRAEWRVIYDHALPLAYGDDITFEDIAEILDTGDRARAHRAVGRCNLQFTREAKPRVLGNVRAVGYRVLRPSEYAPAALGYQTQARRKMTTAVDIMRTAPLHDMTPAQADWAHKVYLVLCDNDLRLRTQEHWRTEAEKRLTELEARAGIPPVIEGEAIEIED
jgi:hypothetical protein